MVGKGIKQTFQRTKNHGSKFKFQGWAAERILNF